MASIASNLKLKFWLCKITLFFLFFSYQGATSAFSCNAEFEKHIIDDMSLSYEEFDQTPGVGMRVLASAGCAKEAADLMVAYMKKHNVKRRSLVWHIAQQRALQGDYVEARKYAAASLLEKEDFEIHPLRWNSYVLATIAFLKKDRDEFLIHYEKVKEARQVATGNESNFKILDSLLVNFDSSYLVATASE